MADISTNSDTETEAPEIRQRQLNQYFWPSLVVGVLLTGAGWAGPVFAWAAAPDYRLVLCCGLGLVLSACGSRATVRFKGLTLIGAAAIAWVLFWMLHEFMDNYVVGEVIGKGIDGAEITVSRGGTTYPGGMVNDNVFEFAITGGNIDKDTSKFNVSIYFPNRGENGETKTFNCIDSWRISNFMGSGDRVSWRFKDPNELHDDKTEQIIDTLDCNLRTRQTANAVQWGSWPRLMGRAHAQGIVSSEIPIEDLLEDLRSGAGYARHKARYDLAQMGPEVVQRLMDALKADNGDSYLLEVGVGVALAEMLRADVNKAGAISQKLEDADIELLVDQQIDKDLTVSANATSFLFDLGDSRAAKVAFDRLREVNQVTDEDLTEPGVALYSTQGSGTYAASRSASPAGSKSSPGLATLAVCRT